MDLSDNIWIATGNLQSNNPIAAVFSGDDFRITPAYTLQLNVWYHFAFVLQGTTGSIYINGSLIGSGITNVPGNLVRSSNFIGRSNWYKYDNQDADAVYDDFKIYKGALTSAAILYEYNSGINQSISTSVAPSSTATSTVAPILTTNLVSTVSQGGRLINGVILRNFSESIYIGFILRNI